MIPINSHQQLWLRRAFFVTANLVILLVAYLLFVEPVQNSWRSAPTLWSSGKRLWRAIVLSRLRKLRSALLQAKWRRAMRAANSLAARIQAS